MIRILDKKQCTGCTACKQVCSHHAVSMQYDEDGFCYPIVDLTICNECGLCEKVCPMLHKDIVPEKELYSDLLTYVVYNKDIKIRERSTSGGIFSVIAKKIIEDGGIVYAARFDEKFRVIHDSFEKFDEIESYRGSKYVESDLRDTYNKIKKDLRMRKVLFVGTPCQVVGLKQFLSRDFDNLYTCDFICMGISSQRHWSEYLDTMWKGLKIKRIFFKDKREGWHQWKMLIEYEGGEYLKNAADDPYFYGYVKRLTMRPSCSECPFRTCKRLSDFTIADAWGIDKVKPEFDDNRGCSIVILQTQKARVLFDFMKPFVNYIKYSIEDVVKYNPYIAGPIELHPEINYFIKKYKEHGFVRAVELCKKHEASFISKVKMKIRRIRMFILKN